MLIDRSFDYWMICELIEYNLISHNLLLWPDQSNGFTLNLFILNLK